MWDPQHQLVNLQRRTFLGRAGLGLGSAALGLLLRQQASGGTTARRDANLSAGLDWAPRAKRIIHLCLAGGPSQHESFDFKPKLRALDGQPFPDSLTRGQQLAQLQNTELKARGSFAKFRRFGNAGLEISELFPHVGSIADEICILRSLHTEQINHDPAHAFLNSGSIIKGRPSMGSWLLYGLGSESADLPGFVVLTARSQAGGAQPISARQWSAGFLPSRHQGVQFQTKGTPVHYLDRPPGVGEVSQEALIETINQLNRTSEHGRTDPELETRIAQYELAFRMQTSIPELADFGDEPEETLNLYGIRDPRDGSFASSCLLARRLVERGVRVVQVYHRAWDHHGEIEKEMPKAAREVDEASAALVLDLKRRGLLDDTLVICVGEFGRTPMGQGSGRDHHILSFSGWLAGGGIRPGMSYGETDELGYRAEVNPVSVHDLHATILHLFGIDHERLTFKYQGRDFRLTDVFGNVVREILV
jgi:hypothetical protein